MKWRVSLWAVYEIGPLLNDGSDSVVEEFINSFKHAGELVRFEYEYYEFLDGRWEFTVEAEMLIECETTNKWTVKDIALNELKYMGRMKQPLWNIRKEEA